ACLLVAGGGGSIPPVPSGGWFLGFAWGKGFSMNTKTFARRNKVRIASVLTDRNPYMEGNGEREQRNGNRLVVMNHYKVRLRHGGEKMDLYYSMGVGLSGEPTAADVLDCLASDACGVEGGQSFHDWCGEYGYDTDSRQALRTYKAIVRQAGKLKTLLGNTLFQQLLYKTERL
ncbi:MAG: hypothetical protein ACREGR_03215, partial [Minisyncoccia bacterium]